MDPRKTLCDRPPRTTNRLLPLPATRGPRVTTTIDRTLASFAIGLAILVSCLLSSACTRSPDEQLEQVRIMQNEGQIAESIPLLIDLIESGNRDGEVLYRYGRARSLTGHPGLSVWALDSARDDPEWFVQASQQLAIDAYQSGNFDFALEILERLRNEHPDSPENDLPALLLEARVMLNTRRHYDEALDLVDSILEDFPDEEEAVRLKAVALLGLKRTDEAYQLIRSAGIQASDLSDEPTARESNGSDAEMEAVDSELGLGPNPREAYWCSVRASFKREAGKPAEASQILDECLERFPSSPDLLNEASKLYSKAGRYDRILEILRAAYDDAPGNLGIRTSLVQHLAAMGQVEAAEKLLRDAVDTAETDGATGPVETARTWADLARFLVDHERVDEALEAFDRAVAILGDSASPMLLFHQAEALILAGRYDEALEIADRTPIEVHGPMIRGRVAFERGDYETALKELDAVALLWPDNAPVRYYLARAAEGTGDFDRAIEEYRQAMRSDATLSAARERLAKLHLAEGRVRHAATILRFVSPTQASTPSVEMRLLEIETQARLGLEPNLEIAPTAEMPIGTLRRRIVKALSRGLRKRIGPKSAESVLASLEEKIEASSKGFFRRERVDLLLQAKDLEKATSVAQAGAAEHPDDEDIQLALGRAWVAGGGDLDRAEKLLRGVLERHPDEVDALTALADLASKRADPAAAALYDRALEVAPDHWPAESGRIEGLIAANRTDEAIGRLERYLAHDAPYDGKAALMLADLLGDSERTLERRISLARRAIRFGGGPNALALLVRLDPNAAAGFRAIEKAGTPAVGESDAWNESLEARDADARPTPSS